MCNLYNMTSTRQAIRDFIKTTREYAFNEPSLQVYPNRYAPIVRLGEDGEREMVRARWGMPTPPMFIKGQHDSGVTNIRNTSSAHWRKWLSPDSRCLVPVTSFAEPDPASKKEGDKRTPNAWFALNQDRPLFVFAVSGHLGTASAWRARSRTIMRSTASSPRSRTASSPRSTRRLCRSSHHGRRNGRMAHGTVEKAKKLQRPLPDDKLMFVDPPDVPE